VLICWYVCNVVCWDVDIRTKCICKMSRNARVYASDFFACMQVSFVLVFNYLFCSNLLRQ